MHRREYRQDINRKKEREEEDEYYKIQLKVAAKIKQEEEKEEGMRRVRDRDDRPEDYDARVKREQPDDYEGRSNHRVEDENGGGHAEPRRSKERSKEMSRERSSKERSDDDRDNNRDERMKDESRENQPTNEALKSEMIKLETHNSPMVDQKPFHHDVKPFHNNENQNQNQNQNFHHDERKIVNNNQLGKWNQQHNHHHNNNNHNNHNNQNSFNNYEPVSEFQSRYQLLANDPSNCKFYMKTGACRFGPRCSRNHLRYENSPTILIPNFFQDPRLAIPMLNDRRADSGMEYDEVEMIHEFEKFYDDVIGEFRAAGNVVMFKCCQNYVPHLRGNVYVQFSKPEYALEALKMFNGRFYAGRQLTVELSPVTNWKSSICGLFDKRLCPRGKACNFLHVFRNPGNAYSVPNRTDFDPERAYRSGGYDPSFVNPDHPVFKYYNQRDAYGYRSENAKPTSNSTSSSMRNKWDNDKNDRSHSRSRSRSRDRDSRSRKRHRSHSRSHSRGRSSKSRSHSRSRSRSRSRKRKHSRSKSRSKSYSKSRSRSRSKDKDKSRRSRKHSHSSDSSHDTSTKKKKNYDSDISDTSTDWSDISADEDNN